MRQNQVSKHLAILVALMLAAGLQLAQFHDWAMAISLTANAAWLFE